MFSEEIKCFNDIIKLKLNLKKNKNIEFRETISNLDFSFWETYSSFANTEGGLIILGVKEGKSKNEILGVNNIEELIEEVIATANNDTKVSLNILDSSKFKVISEHGKTLLLIEIPMSKYYLKPIYLNEKPTICYKRVNNTNQMCSRQELVAMLRDSIIEPLDEKILVNFDADDLDMITLEKSE